MPSVYDPQKREFLKRIGLAGVAGAIAIAESKNVFAQTIVANNGITTPSLSTSDTINVETYGAVGDGVTDNYTAIQRAADALTNGGVLYFPRGTFLSSRMIECKAEAIIVRGNSSLDSIIKAKSGFTGDAVLKFYHSPGSDRSVAVYDIAIDVNGANADGITLIKPYDSVILQNIWVNNVGDNYNAYKLIPDASYSADKVSQTVVMVNCLAQHKNSSATGALFYFDTVQEMTLIGCKAFCCIAYPALVQSAVIGLYFKDCRGINIIGCSLMGSSTFPIYIETSTRVSNGFSFIGNTFESNSKIMKVLGSVTYPVSNVFFNFSRDDNSGSAGVEFELTYVTESQIDLMGFDVTLSNCSNSNIRNLHDFVATPSIKSWYCDGAKQLEMAHPLNSGDTGILISINKSGSVATSKVLIGAADSGGTGYRILRVAN